MSFETTCHIIDEMFDILCNFNKGIATVFVNTMSIKSNFSIFGWEKDVYRLSITDFFLKGIIQCKQYEMLSCFGES